jgi:hypothetical protein
MERFSYLGPGPRPMVLVDWGDRWEAPEGPPILFKYQPDGHPARPLIICAECGEPLQAMDIHPQKGPRAFRATALPLPLRAGDEKK